MKPSRIADKASRVILSALLGSTLTDSELLQVSALLRVDSSFSSELARRIQFCVERMSGQPDPADAKSNGGISILDMLKLEVMTFAKEKRLPKAELIRLMESSSPVKLPLDESMTVREIISQFVHNSPESVLRAFINSLRSQLHIVSEDPFLSGIMKRSDKEKDGGK